MRHRTRFIYAKRVAPVALFLFLFLAIEHGHATNGYFSHGYGIRYKGMAGAGVALYLSPMAAATNPGSMAFVGKGYQVSLALFNPNRQYTVAGNPSGFPQTFGLTPGTVESDSRYFFVPSLAANWRLKETVYFGVAVFGNGGMNTNYPTNTFYGTTPTGVDLMQLFVAATLSFQLAEKHGIGISPIFSFQRFQAQGLQAFGNFSSDANKLTNNDYDSATGFGLRIGYFGQWMDFLAFGAAYQTKINMGQFSKYAGLFAGGGDFDIPANWTVGVALGYEAFAIAFDVQRIMYSSISSIANPMFPNLQQAPLGADGAAGFGWEDMTVFKIGVQMQRGEAWTYRAGFSTGKQPIPESEVMFNILAPGVIEKHLTFGVSRKLNSGKELSLSITRALSGSVQGPNPLEAPNQQTIELKMDQWEFGVALTF
ncbi:MAG: outer membrane protein transport protein [candidate division KSB1 bacterium]|nr:outer membrane protein transport protein [candidate division KSB1 bacterium]